MLNDYCGTALSDYQKHNYVYFLQNLVQSWVTTINRKEEFWTHLAKVSHVKEVKRVKQFTVPQTKLVVTHL